MADTSYAAQVASQRSQAADSEDSQDAFANSMRRQGDLGQEGGYPQYGAAGGLGVMPKRDFGYEEYLSHILGSTQFHPDGTAVNGPFAGQHQNEIIENARDKYAQMSPEDRAPFESRVHAQDVRSLGEMQSQGFQYPSQTRQWGAEGPTWSQSQNPSGSAPFSDNPQAGLNLSGGNSAPMTHQADAIPPMQMYQTPVRQNVDDGYRVVGPQSPFGNVSTGVPYANMPRQMPSASQGSPQNTAQFGPRYSGNSLTPQQPMLAQGPQPQPNFAGVVPHPDAQMPMPNGPQAAPRATMPPPPAFASVGR